MSHKEEQACAGLSESQMGTLRASAEAARFRYLAISASLPGLMLRFSGGFVVSEALNG